MIMEVTGDKTVDHGDTVYHKVHSADKSAWMGPNGKFVEINFVTDCHVVRCSDLNAFASSLVQFLLPFYSALSCVV